MERPEDGYETGVRPLWLGVLAGLLSGAICGCIAGFWLFLSDAWNNILVLPLFTLLGSVLGLVGGLPVGIGILVLLRIRSPYLYVAAVVVGVAVGIILWGTVTVVPRGLHLLDASSGWLAIPYAIIATVMAGIRARRLGTESTTRLGLADQGT